MNEPVGDVPRKFVPADFAYVAKMLHRYHRTPVSILLTRLDLNIILAALDAVSEDCA